MIIPQTNRLGALVEIPVLSPAIAETLGGSVKQCTHCKKDKPVSGFPKSKTNRDGLGSWCKSCTQEAVRRVQREGKRPRSKSITKLKKTRIKYIESIAQRKARYKENAREVRIARHGIKRVNGFLPEGWLYCSKCKTIKRSVDFYGTGYCAECKLGHPPRRTTPEQQRECQRAYQREYKRKDRLTIRGQARTKFNLAIHSGRIIRPKHCSECGKPCIPHGHHFDYSKPLEVIWLCSACHGRRHTKSFSHAAHPAERMVFNDNVLIRKR